MSVLVAAALYGASGLFWLIAAAIGAIGEVAVRVAEPFKQAAGWCLQKAREWDPRLTDRGQHTDLGPPPGASP